MPIRATTPTTCSAPGCARSTTTTGRRTPTTARPTTRRTPSCSATIRRSRSAIRTGPPGRAVARVTGTGIPRRSSCEAPHSPITHSIPTEAVGDGPPLEWIDVPVDAAEFAVLCEDRDAGDAVHCGSPPASPAPRTGIGSATDLPRGAVAGRADDGGAVGWHPPHPPVGEVHRFTSSDRAATRSSTCPARSGHRLRRWRRSVDAQGAARHQPVALGRHSRRRAADRPPCRGRHRVPRAGTRPARARSRARTRGTRARPGSVGAPRRSQRLVLTLHGAGGDAPGGLAPLLPLADAHRLLLVAPSPRDSTWDVITQAAGERRAPHRRRAHPGLRHPPGGPHPAGDQRVLRRRLLRAVPRARQRRPLHPRHRVLPRVPGPDAPDGHAARLPVTRPRRHRAAHPPDEPPDRPGAAGVRIPVEVHEFDGPTSCPPDIAENAVRWLTPP